ncbi:MAG TPA: hypothetical protein PLD47_03845 [Aggregatilineales bacterium]|nr:hypothetical protein [Anaerolineales bacterium]HRE46834.1 hypothetical protein [Aggregatilineales bacterium]
MTLPFKLQRLPEEALTILRYLYQTQAATVPALENGTGLSNRAVLRAIRRLINDGLIDSEGRNYVLTTDGKLLTRQLLDFDAKKTPDNPGGGETAPNYTTPATIFNRRLQVVFPRIIRAVDALNPQPWQLMIAVSAPNLNEPQMPRPARITLKMSAIGGTLSTYSVTISVPQNRVSDPVSVIMNAAQPGTPMRINIDVAQIIPDVPTMPALGGGGGLYQPEPEILLDRFYVDVGVAATPQGVDLTPTARAINLRLNS